MRFTVLITTALFIFSVVPGICFGQNKVVVIPLGADCPPGLTVCNGTCVDTNNNPSFCGGCSTECGIGRFCSQGVCIGRFGDPCTTDSGCLSGGCLSNVCADVKLVFVTADSWTGNLGGLPGADDKCQAEADAASLPGTYKAWLSTTALMARDRLTHSPGMYKLVDGTTVATSWTEIVDGALDNAITVNALGGSETGYVWTATYHDGLNHPDDCTAWGYGIEDRDGYAGFSHPLIATSAWTSNATWACDESLKLYCFQQ